MVLELNKNFSTIDDSQNRFDKGFDSNKNFEWLINKNILPLIAMRIKPAAMGIKEITKECCNALTLIEDIYYFICI
ncbi:MAG: hypothetical protein QXQ40_02065 [Candidatus Aenigmatarchaeota archaeon]